MNGRLRRNSPTCSIFGSRFGFRLLRLRMRITPQRSYIFRRDSNNRFYLFSPRDERWELIGMRRRNALPKMRSFIGSWQQRTTYRPPAHPCQNADVMKFRSSRPLTLFDLRDFSHLYTERSPHSFYHCACCYRCCPLAAATPCPTLPFKTKLRLKFGISVFSLEKA
jgi:hypothetical protein